MVFSSLFFLFAFLPPAILGYYGQYLLVGNRLRNVVLLTLSYLFYLFGAPDFVLFLAASTLFDYTMGRLMASLPTRKRLWLSLSIIVNLSLLVWFKYANFMVAEFSGLLDAVGIDTGGWESVALPVGISFFTFQKLSYTIDVYRQRCRPVVNVVDFAMYVALFPQLVAGPIVRFIDIRDQIRGRVETWDGFFAGATRFCWGLGKKVILADSCGRVADAVFGLGPTVLEIRTAWLGALAYTLQIYLDFSAYSDMAIGLGQCFGFRFAENFNRPYTAASLTDFWHRWHISLSRWFRDYLYIPLGGNRRGPARTAINLSLVFLLCGLWHGANWTFVAWGAYHGAFLVIERITGLRQVPEDFFYGGRRLLTMLAVVCGWVIFRCDSLAHCSHYFTGMFTGSAGDLHPALTAALDLKTLLWLLISATALILPPGSVGKRFQRGRHRPMAVAAATLLFVVVLPWCAAIMAGDDPNPFIYYRF